MPGERTVEFWALIQRAHDRGGDERLAPLLTTELAALPIPRIVEFHGRLMDVMRTALTWDLWGAATVIHGGACSQDAFCYFRLWLIAQGSETFHRAVEAPDTLASHHKIIQVAGKPPESWEDSDFPHPEELMYVAEQAFDHVLGRLPAERAARIPLPEGLGRRPAEVPPGSSWDLDDPLERGRRLPSLTRLFS